MLKHNNVTSISTLLLLTFSLLHISSASRVDPNSSLKSFNVKKFGARGDGKTDATQAFLDAWEAACAASGSVQLYVPKGKYVLKPLIFEGISCKTSSILFRIDGTIVAPDDYSVVSKSFSWICFHMVNGLHIKGGVLDAKGESLWDCKLGKKQSCPIGAKIIVVHEIAYQMGQKIRTTSLDGKSLSFDNSKNVIVEGLTSVNSQMFHITINACQNLNMVGLTITADENSPNTDGIHMERSQGITIAQSNIQTGDDCISIGPDNKNIWIENVHCGPGHGISIGSLGSDSSEDVEVSNVTVKSATFTGTDNGLRIKTWAKPTKGKVHDVFFLGAQMSNVRNPIIVDQNYCPHGGCSSGQASGIQINNVVYKGIHGTSSSPVAVTFDCSSKYPCKSLTLQDIQLSYQPHSTKSECKNAYGKTIGSTRPSSCLH